MLGAIAGDVIGSVYEYSNIKSTDFSLFTDHSKFTDDTILTVAVAHNLLSGEGYVTSLRKFGRRYPSADYGGSFGHWLFSENSPSILQENT